MMRNPASQKESIVAFCAAIGDDPMLVQGAGGNVSWKDGETLWIKASGTWLAHAAGKDIFVPVCLPPLRAAVDRGDFTVTPTVIGASPLRPSIETLLHVLMPHRVVVHIHAIEALAHLVRKDWHVSAGMLLGASLQWTTVPYKKPGAELAAAVSAALAGTGGANVVFLQNHGVVIGGADVGEVSATVAMLTRMMRTEISPDNAEHAGPAAIGPLVVAGEQYVPIPDPEVQRLATDAGLFARLKTQWALYPDHVVFLGAAARTYPDLAALHASPNQGEGLVELVFVAGVGVFARLGFTIAKQVQLRCYYDVLVRLQSDSSIGSLNDTEIAELLNWDAEQYRMNLSKS